MPKKILLADDSITIQKVVELTFSDGDYEVTAVNNGAKAVQKLSEMRPDIILSDIIMPEKNGYEVCEYVKSHPDFRNIPVVLLTGTFEPFDPDRAEKAGCDAVVTKPFESQSLIHKVEELIAQSANAAPAAAAAEPEPEAASPWMEEPAAPAASPLGTGVFTPAAPADSFTHDEDIFSAPAAPDATTEMPFETPAETPFGAPPAAEAFSSETRAFPRMSFDDLPQPGAFSEPATEATSAPETPSWAAADAPSSEVPAWPDTAAAEEPPPPPPAFASLETPMPSASPFEEPAAGGETRAFPKMSFDDFAPGAPAEAAAEPSAEPESMSWNAPEQPAFEEEAPAFGGETRAFPKMSFDQFEQTPAPEASGWDAAPEAPAWSEPETPAFAEPAAFGSEPSAFDSEPSASGSEQAPLETESPAFSAETSAFPKMSFDDFQTPPPSFDEPQATPEVESEPVMETEPAPAEAVAEPLPWDEAPAPESDAFWSPASERPTVEPAADESFSMAEPQPFAAPAQEELPSSWEATEESSIESEPETAEQPEWAAAAGAQASAEAAAEEEEPVVPPPALAPEAPAMPIAAHSADLTDEQIDRIARRVVELMSEKVVRNIAWEVIPDMAEMVVKERIRQLEAEA